MLKNKRPAKAGLLFDGIIRKIKINFMIDTNLNVLVLNASLKHHDTPSNTEEVTEIVLGHMKKQAEFVAETIRLSDKDIPVGLGFKESETDEWPAIVEKIKAADIVIFATPIWWGSRSSLMQRVIERMDAFDEEVIAGGRKRAFK